jgi:hypothetical protein
MSPVRRDRNIMPYMINEKSPRRAFRMEFELRVGAFQGNIDIGNPEGNHL